MGGKMRFFKKTDLIIVLFIVLISITAWFSYRSIFAKPSHAEIYYYSTLAKTVDLNKGIEETFSIPQNEHVVFHLYKDGKIRFEQSNCPDQICVKAGLLNTSGQFAACLPNGIILKIVSNNSNSDIDAVSGK